MWWKGSLVFVIVVIILLLPASVLADSPQPSILLVEDAHIGYNNSVLAPYFKDALTANGYSYDTYIVSGSADNGPPNSTMGRYDIVIWFTGNDYGGDFPTLTEVDQEELAKYLDSGGRLFITGQDIGYDVGEEEFYEDYLHADYRYNKNLDNDLVGIDGDPVGDNFFINISGGAGNQQSPSIIAPVDAYASGIFDYQSYKRYVGWGFYWVRYGVYYGALRADTGVYKVVYLAFGFEGIDSEDSRNFLMRRIIGYLSSPDARDTLVSPNLTNSSPVLSAICVDNEHLSHINRSEYFVDAIGSSGLGTALFAQDGAFDEAVENVNGTVSISGLSDGNHTVYVHCMDKSGYWGKFDTYNFTLDTTPPSAPDISIFEDPTNDDTPTLTITPPPSNVPDYIAFSCDDISYTSWMPWVTSYSEFNITSGPGCSGGDGTKTVYVKGKDFAGNVQTAARNSDSVTLDRTAPTVISTDPANGSYLKSSTNITIIFADALTGVQSALYNNGTSNQSFSNNTPFNPGWSSDGVKALQVWVQDNAGNVNYTMYGFTVDDTPPVINIQNPENGKRYAGNISLTAPVIDYGSGVDQAWYNILNASNTSQVVDSGVLTAPDWNATWNSTAYTNGTFVFNVSANDTLGNLQTANVTFDVDNLQPSAVIHYPKRVYLNSNFTLNLKGEKVGNLSNCTYYIYNASGVVNWSQQTDINAPVCRFTNKINISGWKDGNYSINFTAEDDLGNTGYDKSWFYLDTQPPQSSGYTLNLTTDLNFGGDYRAYSGECVKFSVILYDGRNVSDVIATSNSSGTLSNVSLSPETLNYTNDTWSFACLNTSLLGMYSIESLYMNDSLGNAKTVSSTEINKSFIVVEPWVSIFGSVDMDAGSEKMLNITFHFNKTVNNPVMTVYIPPNNIDNFTQTPRYVNSSSYNCSFGSGCSVVSGLCGSDITYLNLTGNNSGTLLLLQTNITAGAPPLDVSDNWTAVYRQNSYRTSTSIKTPYLNITNVKCNESSLCIVYQNIRFNLSATVQNINQQGNHSGNASNVRVKFSTSGYNSTYSLGNIISGANATAVWSVNITQAGNYTFNFTSWEQTGRYNATQYSRLIQVRDTQRPEVTKTELLDDIINLNESIIFYITARDNTNISSVWVGIKNGTTEMNYSTMLHIGTTNYGIWNFTYVPPKVGRYNITTVYVNDTSGNILAYPAAVVFEVRKLVVNVTLSNNFPLLGDSLSIVANISGNASGIESVRAVITKPHNYNETIILDFDSVIGNISRFVGTYNNISRSGNYTVNTTVTAGKSISNITEFYVDFGNISITAAEGYAGYLELPFGTGPYNLSWFIIPVNGDLVEVNGYLNIENESVINLTSDEPSNKSFGNITYESYPSGKLVSFEVNETAVGITNVTLTANSSLLGKQANISITINVTPADTENPFLHSYGNDVNTINLMETVIITVNATDNSAIDNVTIQINYPSMSENFTATKIGSGLYKLEFSNSNETGNYSYRVFVYDVSGNLNSSDSTGNWTAFDNYSVTAYPEYTSYNKGENVSINVIVRNVNNQDVRGFNLTLIVYNGTNHTIVDNQQVSNVTYFIYPDFVPISGTSPYTYLIYANVSKNGNTGISQNGFNVTKVLSTDFVTPDDGDYFSVGSIVQVEVTVNNVRGDPVTDAVVTAQCSDCGTKYVFLEHLTGARYVNFYAFSAPSTGNNQFSIFAHSIDHWKNDEGIAPGILLTTSAPSQPSNGGAGSEKSVEGGPASICVPEPEICEDGVDNDCDGLIDCRDPSCFTDPVCMEIVKGFSFVLDHLYIGMLQGENVTVVGTLSNTGSINATFRVSVESNCCLIFAPSELQLQPQEERDFPVIIHSPLAQLPGEYLVTIKVEAHGIEKTKTVKVMLEQNPLISTLGELENRLSVAKDAIEDYIKTGVGVEWLREKALEAENELTSARLAIQQDDLNVLKNSVDKATKLINLIELTLLGEFMKKFLLENIWYIVIGTMLVFIVTYLIHQVLIPFYRLGKDITLLKNKEKVLVNASIEAEREYFTRKIDRATFYAIMAENQSKILAVRSAIKDKIRERQTLLKARLRPSSVITWLKSIGRYIKHRIKK